MEYVLSSQIKQILTPYDDDMIKNVLCKENLNDNEQHIKIVKFNYMCARGLINDVVAFIKDHDKDKDFIINGIHPFFHFGNSLHTSLYYNSSHIAFELFKILSDHGAIIERDYYGSLPWEQYSIDGMGLNWIHPLERVLLGKRSDEEFNNIYHMVRDHVNQVEHSG